MTDNIDHQHPADRYASAPTAAMAPAYPDEKRTETTADGSLRSSLKEGRDIEGQRNVPEVEKKDGWYQKYHMKHILRASWLCLFTGWWIASLVLHRNDKNWVVPFLLWLCVALRVLTFYVQARLVMVPLRFVWKQTGVRVMKAVPEKWRIPGAAAIVVATYLVGSFVSKETEQNTRADRAISCLGLVVFIFVLWATSRNRAAIKWHTVIVGMLMQFIIALFVLRTGVGYDIFNFVSTLARSLLGFAKDGVAFLTNEEIANLGYFFFSVLPAIVFFIALVQLLYYYHILHWFIGKFAKFFFWSMKVSGAEAVVAAASPFIGQGESAMLIKPFVPHLTMAELHQVMCSGFATIAGSVLVAYLAMGIDPQALISSCVMSIPASLAVSKLRYPETEEPLTAGHVSVPHDDTDEAANGLHAFANGTWLGLKIAAMIMGTQMCIIAFIALIDALLSWWGYYLNISDGLTLEMILGYLLYPVSFLLGVSRHGDDIYRVAQLIGLKLIANEFVAYIALQSNPLYANLTQRSRLIATYALCGFANIGSLGTQIGVLQQVAPGRGGDVSRVAISALLSGAISTLTSASVAGMVIISDTSEI
ncbi:Na+ dependent nucleoside transporter C-terminus-domain-containing protein [Tricharina praecox]|uniref:Na+ dependent nucleoside transporter C-terminus-domain-containing protein n=1 Tax=Tricharina praecox TaxID=43433 RepID=UPI0022201CA2|nr:Na+ dependent nucleoside transporter C-terminus-domain-containing protein [Tricharina praecox]KAI5858828.1 Na+ dependent nucleoside transporter C-terminus-domain-containing protein [Tricharina praecox]